VSSPVDIALIGDEDELRRRLDALEAGGVTDFCANLVGPDEGREATLALVGDIARERAA